MLLVKNTAWARQFFKEVAKVFRRPKVQVLYVLQYATRDMCSSYLTRSLSSKLFTCWAQVMRTFLTRDQHLHGPRNATMDQVMMYMLLKDKGVNQPKVRLPASTGVIPCTEAAQPDSGAFLG